MNRPLILHQTTAMDVSPLELIDIAAATDCKAISVFTHLPQAVLPGQKGRLVFPAITQPMKRDVLKKLADTSVTVNGVEFFPITADTSVGEYISSLALGRELGAVRAVTHIHDVDEARAVDRLGALCDLAGTQELSIGIEFTPLTRGCVSLQRAAWFVDQVGKSNLGIGVDALHLVRSGGTAADIESLESRYFTNLQICDGHGLHCSSDYMNEAHNRELPGAGDFPLMAILRALPATVAVEIEVPAERRTAEGTSAVRRAMDAVSHSRAVMNVLQTR